MHLIVKEQFLHNFMYSYKQYALFILEILKMLSYVERSLASHAILLKPPFKLEGVLKSDNFFKAPMKFLSKQNPILETQCPTTIGRKVLVLDFVSLSA